MNYIPTHSRVVVGALAVFVLGMAVFYLPVGRAERFAGARIAKTRSGQKQSTNAAAKSDPQALEFTNGKIALERGTGNSVSIITVDETGGNESNLGSGRQPSWSTDGAKIVFVQGDFDDQGSLAGTIWIMNADGSNKAPVIDAETGKSLVGTSPQLSPDGKKLAFIVFDDFSIVYTMDVQFGATISATNRKPLTGNTETCFDPSWQPLLDTTTGTFTKNGKIAFDAYENGPQNIYTINAEDGTGRKLLTTTPGLTNRNPSWSPDGTKILFTSNMDRSHPDSVYVMDPNDGSNPKKLTTGFFDNSAKFSPDGRFIVYVSSVEGNGDALFVADLTDLNADGTVKNPIRISTGNHDSSPSWAIGPPPSADLSVTVSAFPDPAVQNNELYYTLTVTNNGPTAATGVTVTDSYNFTYLNFSAASDGCTGPVPQQNGALSDVTCSIGKLAIGASATSTIVFRATTPTSVGGGTGNGVPNTARVKGNEPDPKPDNNTQTITTVIKPDSGTADLGVSMIASPPSPFANTNLTYTISLVNNGPSAVNAGGNAPGNLVDTLPAGVTFVSVSDPSCQPNSTKDTVICNFPTLTSGSSFVTSIVVRPTQAGIITNTATATTGSVNDPNTSNNTASVTTTVGPPVTDMTVSMGAENATGGPLTGGTVLAGQLFRLHPTVSNLGPSPSTGSTLTITLPSGIGFAANADNSGNCQPSGNKVVCTVPGLNAAESTGLLIYLKATQGGTFNIQASVVGKEPELASDTNPNSVSATVTVIPAADLESHISASPSTVAADAPLTYSVQFTNNGPMTDPNVSALLFFDSDVFYIGASQGCALGKDAQGNNTRSVQCSIGSILPGQTLTKQIQVRPKGNVPQITFGVSRLMGDLPDINGSNDIPPNLVTNVTANTRPLNDNFLPEQDRPGSGPGQLNGLSGQITGTNVYATMQMPIDYGLGANQDFEQSHAGQVGGKSVWYKWKPPSSSKGGMCVDTDGSSFDTLLAVYVKDVTTGAVQREAVSNDQHEPTNSTCEFFVSGKNTTFANGDSSQIFLSYDAQHEYYFVVDGKQGATGSVQLNWIALATGNTSSAPVIPTISGMTPETACSASSTATDVCGQPGKDLLLHIIGRDFIAGKTRVIVKGFDILGAPGGTIEYLAKPSDPNRDCLYFEKDHPLTGVCSEMIVHVPPRPPLGEIGIDSVRTLTPVDTPASSSAKTSLENLSVGAGGYSGILLPPAKYVIGFGSRALNVVDVQTDVIPPGTEQQVCFGLSDGTLCMDWTNRGSKPATFLPTFFAAYARCLDLDFPEPRGTCENSTLHSTEFAINPQLVFIGETYFTKRVDITPIQAQLIKSTGGTVGFAFEGGVPKLLSPSGGQIVSQGAGNLIGNAGDALIGNAGGTLIGNAGGTLIDNAGGTLLSHDGSGLVSHDGGSLIGQDGTTLVSHDGGSLTPGSILGGSTQDQSLRSSLSIGQGARAQSSQHGDFSQGVGGFFLAQSSGGQDATLTSTTDPVTGEVKTYLQINFDGTSFPRASDLAGMAFTVVVNPALIKVASQNITVNPGASSAAIKVTRTGDKSLPVILDYSTSDATAKADTDYTATSGSVTFAPGETEKTISVPLLGASGASRKFNLVIGNVVGGVLQAPNFTSVTLPQSVPVWEPVALSASQTEIKTWTLGGRTYAYLKLSFPNAGFRVTDWGQAIRTGSDFAANASVEKFSGLSVQAVTTTAGIYDLGPLADGNYTFTFKNSGTVVKTLPFTVSSVVPPPNPIDDARQFVKQQYRDFLNREADQAGEDFWTDNITKCNDPARRPAGQTVEQCTLRQRETTSGAFFLSPEFQYTGYYVLRMYQGALGRQPKLSEFLPDAQFVGNGIVVNGGLSAAKINQNKADYAAQFVNCTDAAKYRCSEFKAIYDALNNTQYVDKLFLTTGVNGSASDRAALVSGLNGGSETRASVLQKVVDGVTVLGEGNQQFTTTYGQAFYDQQFTRAFVQLEYFGYMKRDPDEAGYNFWLGKLNQFGGNFVNAEMVLAFISSPEYRARFGQP